MRKYILSLFLPLLAYSAPVAPINLTLQPLSASSVSLSWEDNNLDTTGFKIFRDEQFLTAVSPLTSSYTDTGLDANTRYTYTVKASDDVHIYEDAQANNILNWSTYRGADENTKIEKVFDTQKQSYVIALTGNGTQTGFQIDGSWANTEQKNVSWSLKYSEDFSVFIVVNTANGIRYMHYTPEDVDYGTAVDKYVHHGLGHAAKDGKWHTFSRDIYADLYAFEPDNTIISINTFLIRGSGRVDDILMADTILPKVINQAPLITQPLITPTTPKEGDLYASPTGAENASCTEADPCSITTAISQLTQGETLFLYGGIYNLRDTLLLEKKSTEEEPIIVESYPHQHAILDGGETIEHIKANQDVMRNAFYIVGASYVYIRDIEIRHMGGKGVFILNSDYCKVEGSIIHDNFLAGIQIYDSYRPYQHGYHTIQNNTIYNNSDAGITALQESEYGTFSYNDGDNADGISISSGFFNNVINNRVFANSDDGIDTWLSNDSQILYNIAYDNGRGEKGNGNGIKLGGDKYHSGKYALRTVASYNISYGNKMNGFDWNEGLGTTMTYNTAYDNKAYGFLTDDSSILQHNIALDNGIPSPIKALHSDNSWQIEEKVEVISKDPASIDFVRPRPGSIFENIGAYVSEI